MLIEEQNDRLISVENQKNGCTDNLTNIVYPAIISKQQYLNIFDDMLHMMRSSAYREIKSVLTLNQFPERKSLLEREVGFSEGNRFQELT